MRGIPERASGISNHRWRRCHFIVICPGVGCPSLTSQLGLNPASRSASLPGFRITGIRIQRCGNGRRRRRTSGSSNRYWIPSHRVLGHTVHVAQNMMFINFARPISGAFWHILARLSRFLHAQSCLTKALRKSAADPIHSQRRLLRPDHFFHYPPMTSNGLQAADRLFG
jgi:hypothetical protein